MNPLVFRAASRAIRPLLWAPPADVSPAVEKLRHLVTNGAVLHGTRRGDLQEVHTRRQTNYLGQAVEGVFATRDPIWPIFYAILDRSSAGSLRCQCLAGRKGSRYCFSTEGDPQWAPGYVYVLPGDDFVAVAGTNEMVCATKSHVEVVEGVQVQPTDFPFLTRVGRHHRSEPTWRTLWRLRSN